MDTAGPGLEPALLWSHQQVHFPAAAAKPSSGRRKLNLNHHHYQFVDYRASVAQQQPNRAAGPAHQGTRSRRSRLQCDSACQTDPTLALSLLVDYVAQSTLHEADTQDPCVEAMHAVLAFQRRTTIGPEQAPSQPTEVSHGTSELSFMHCSPLHCSQSFSVGTS